MNQSQLPTRTADFWEGNGKLPSITLAKKLHSQHRPCKECVISHQTKNLLLFHDMSIEGTVLADKVLVTLVMMITRQPLLSTLRDLFSSF